MRHILTITSLVLLAGCATVVPPAARPAAPAPVPVYTPPPPPAPPPAASSDWRDWAVTPGSWNYMRTQGGSGAAYATAHHGTLFFTIRCERANGGQLILTRIGATAGTMTVRTSSITRNLTVTAVTGGASVSLPVSDQLIDAMGYSRGRFIVETAPLPPLVIPAWAEVLRVAEDCRR